MTHSTHRPRIVSIGGCVLQPDAAVGHRVGGAVHGGAHLPAAGQSTHGPRPTADRHAGAHCTVPAVVWGIDELRPARRRHEPSERSRPLALRVSDLATDPCSISEISSAAVWRRTSARLYKAAAAATSSPTSGTT